MRMSEKQNINQWTELLSKVDASAKHANLWREVRRFVSKPRRSRVVVNLTKLNKIARDGEFIVVPGKVLAAGKVDHKFSLAAVEYSGDAMKKLKEGGCTIVNVSEILKLENPRIVI